jgi:hypothetical protein
VDPGLADELDGPWPSEEIPDADLLFMRVHRNLVEHGRPAIGVFKNRPDPARSDRAPGMSTDWNRYSTPQQTQDRARSSRPEDNGVCSLNVGRVRGIYDQRVIHTPHYRVPDDSDDPNNRAHTDVAGKKSPKETNDPEERVRLLRVRVEFQEISRWEIPPPDRHR